MGSTNSIPGYHLSDVLQTI